MRELHLKKKKDFIIQMIEATVMKIGKDSDEKYWRKKAGHWSVY